MPLSSPATSGTKVVTSLWVPVKNRFSLNGYRLWKKSGFYILSYDSDCNVSVMNAVLHRQSALQPSLIPQPQL